MPKQQQPATPVAETTVTITLREALALHGAYSSLDAGRIPSGDTVNNIFDGATTYRIAANIAALKPTVDNYTTSRNTLVREFASSEKPNEVSPDKASDFMAREMELLTESTTVTLRTLDYTKLLNDSGKQQNLISATAISVLLPYITNIPE